MRIETDGVAKLLKLWKSVGFAHWRRRMYAFIRWDDIDLIFFTDRMNTGAAELQSPWLEITRKENPTIGLTLGTGRLTQVSKIVDDDERKAKELWDELEHLYTTLNLQRVINLNQELENLQYEDCKYSEENINRFQKILEKLSTFD